ncbi:MAG: FhaA domain-containing protein [Acidobacteriota bacterium]
MKRKWIEGLRKWIDGEEEIEGEQTLTRSKWDDFLVSIAREVEACMQQEMFTPPGGPTYIPREYMIFLNPEDDAQWQGEKREGLERGLRHVLEERARELAGDNQFQTRTLALELRVDAALERGRFRVQHTWDSEAEKTMVKPRRRAEKPKEETDDEATVVRPRKGSDKAGEPLFSITARRLGQEGASETTAFYKDEISIGRGSRQVAVDLKLEGDMEVSRKHATLTRREGGFRIECHGANPVVIDGSREIPAGESAEVRPGEKIVLCSYELVIEQPKAGGE